MSLFHCYLDSSVVLRKLFEQKNSLAEWKDLTNPLSSPLLKVECLRAIDRFRLYQSPEDAYMTTLYSNYHLLIEAIQWITLDQTVLDRAGHTFPTNVRTLDAIHLATALVYKETGVEEVSIATHDQRLAEAAICLGFKVIGL